MILLCDITEYISFSFEVLSKKTKTVSLEMLIFADKKTLSHTTKGLIKNAEFVAVQCCFVTQ